MTTSLATLSIKFDPQYSALRICAQTCVDRGNDNSDLEGHLECGDSKILNACFCRDDLRPKATTFLSSCIISRCRYNDQDVTSAWNLYDGYCSFEPLLATTAVSTTRSGSTESAMSPTTISPTRPSTGPASSTNPAASPPAPPALSESPDSSNTAKISSAGEPISAGAIAGIVIGGVITLILGVAIVIWIRHRGRGNRQTMMGATKPGEYPGSSYLQGAIPDKVEESRGAESFDMGTMTAAKMETTLPHTLMGDTSPLVQPVEICDTGFRAELSAGDDVRYSKEKTWQLPT